MAAIELHGLTKRFGAVTAVDDLTLELGAGTVTGFLGPNGAGKTTTLRMLLGLVAPTAGTATFDGRDYADLDQPARQVGAVLEASSFHPGRRAVDHLRILASAAGLPAERVDEALTRSAWRSTPAGGSVASHSACANASAWPPPSSASPSVLVLDEPANGLDPEGVHWLRTFLRSLADAGRTVLVSSHLLAEVAQTVDHVVILDKGRLVASSSACRAHRQRRSPVIVRTPDADRFRPSSRTAASTPRSPGPMRSQPAAPRPRRSARSSAALGLVVYEMRLDESNLEDVFFSLTATTEGSRHEPPHPHRAAQAAHHPHVRSPASSPPRSSPAVTLAILSSAGKQGNEPLGPDNLVQVIGGPPARSR